jgi:hypothetical protein
MRTRRAVIFVTGSPNIARASVGRRRGCPRHRPVTSSIGALLGPDRVEQGIADAILEREQIAVDLPAVATLRPHATADRGNHD